MNDGSRRSTRGTRSWFSKRRSRGQHAAGECGARQPVACQPDRAGKCRQSRRSIAFGSDAAGTPDRRYAGGSPSCRRSSLQTGKIATALIRLNESAKQPSRGQGKSSMTPPLLRQEAGVRVRNVRMLLAQSSRKRKDCPALPRVGLPAHHAGDLRKVAQAKSCRFSV